MRESWFCSERLDLGQVQGSKLDHVKFRQTKSAFFHITGIKVSVTVSNTWHFKSRSNHYNSPHQTFSWSSPGSHFLTSSFFVFKSHSYLVSLILDHLQRDRFKIRKFYFLVHNVQFAPAGLPTRPSEEYKKLAKNGGCGLHVDAEDPIYNSGLLMYYSCFVEPDVEDCDRDHPLPQNDLVCFQHQNGERGARIQTMHPNFLCLAFHQSWKCHGTVFQENDVFQEGIHGFRVVTYPIKAVEDLVEHCQDEAPFQSVLQQWKTALLNSFSPKKLQCGLDRIFNKTLE